MSACMVAAIDPALLVFSPTEIENPDQSTDERLGALMLHREFVEEYSVQVAMTDRHLGMLWQCHPFSASRETKRKLHDFFAFFDRLQRLIAIVPDAPHNGVPLAPDCVLCLPVDDPEVGESFRTLLASALEWAGEIGVGLCVGTWASNRLIEQHICRKREDAQPSPSPTSHDGHCLRLVWRREDWASVLYEIGWWWPEMTLLVPLCFDADPGFRAAAAKGATPSPIHATDRFTRSLDRNCLDLSLRRALTEAVMKLAYGIPDGAMDDKKFKGHRRCRVTGFWRLYYDRDDLGIELLEFVPHE